MIYFFKKHQDNLQCEIHPGRPHALTIIEPGGAERTERYATSREIEARWEELRQLLHAQGWHGPFGRDARI